MIHVSLFLNVRDTGVGGAPNGSGACSATSQQVGPATPGCVFDPLHLDIPSTPGDTLCAYPMCVDPLHLDIPCVCWTPANGSGTSGATKSTGPSSSSLLLFVFFIFLRLIYVSFFVFFIFLELSDTRVYEPSIRARLGTAAGHPAARPSAHVSDTSIGCVHFDRSQLAPLCSHPKMPRLTTAVERVWNK